MRHSTFAALVLGLLSSTSSAAPLTAAELGSKHNLYLATCQRKPTPNCILIFCGPDTTYPKFTAVALFPNGPISTTNATPLQVATVTSPAARWEGVQRAARLSRVAVFTSSIDAGAASLEKSSVAGSATVGTENFACFKDGDSEFTVKGDLGEDTYSCTADYWCPSISVV